MYGSSTFSITDGSGKSEGYLQGVFTFFGVRNRYVWHGRNNSHISCTQSFLDNFHVSMPRNPQRKPNPNAAEIQVQK